MFTYGLVGFTRNHDYVFSRAISAQGLGMAEFVDAFNGCKDGNFTKNIREECKEGSGDEGSRYEKVEEGVWKKNDSNKCDARTQGGKVRGRMWEREEDGRRIVEGIVEDAVLWVELDDGTVVIRVEPEVRRCVDWLEMVKTNMAFSLIVLRLRLRGCRNMGRVRCGILRDHLPI
ncbi:hypothetical protein VNO80_14411 [Phaseolus coccineus]|uniref:Uncharacterized protein n=1 Tax=Phaseolus coccineus TaxID=3886 RepID=A0AAN9MPH0_PHACN